MFKCRDDAVNQSMVSKQGSDIPSFNAVEKS